MNIDYAQVLDGCKRGDTKAQEALYKEFSPSMFGVAMRYLTSREDAQDLLHDAFIKILTSIKKVNDPETLPAWMNRVMFNTVMDFFRNNRKMFVYGMEGLEWIEDEDAYKDQEMDLDDFSMDEIMAAIATLRPSFRAVFNMREVEGMKYADIARNLGISEQTARAHHSKAAAILRKQLEQKTIKRNIS